jgi:hypothetical protein
LRQLFRSYWFWFYVTVSLVSIIDFIDHISRTDSHFRDIWFEWLLFTISCTLTICFTIYSTSIMTKKLFRADNLFSQSISIILGLLTHIYLSGPLFDRLIFGQVTLNFFPTPIIFIAGLGIFFSIRLLIYLITKRTKPIGQDIFDRP